MPALGVLEPVIADRKDDGTVHVLMGQRRTLGAIEAGCQSIPVVIVATPEEADRIVNLVVENIQRIELTDADACQHARTGSRHGVILPQNDVAHPRGRLHRVGGRVVCSAHHRGHSASFPLAKALAS